MYNIFYCIVTLLIVVGYMSLFRYILLLLVLFAIPGVMMIVAYGLISRELYRGIQFEMGHKKDSSGKIRTGHHEYCMNTENNCNAKNQDPRRILLFSFYIT